MLTACFKFDRNCKVLAVLAVLLLLILPLRLRVSGAKPADAADAARRMDFLHGLGYDVSEARMTKREITIPAVFDDVYAAYNDLQLQAGYDLTRYRGKRVLQYTYTTGTERDPVLIHLLTYRGRVIGGDVCTAALDGYMKPLTGS